MEAASDGDEKGADKSKTAVAGSKASGSCSKASGYSSKASGYSLEASGYSLKASGYSLKASCDSSKASGGGVVTGIEKATVFAKVKLKAPTRTGSSLKNVGNALGHVLKVEVMELALHGERRTGRTLCPRWAATERSAAEEDRGVPGATERFGRHPKNLWSKSGKWQRLFEALQTDSDDEWHSLGKCPRPCRAVAVSIPTEQREISSKLLREEKVVPPLATFCGDMDAILEDRLLAVLGATEEVFRVLLPTHAKVEMVQRSVNFCGCDQQLALPVTAQQVYETINGMIERTRGIRERFDRLRLVARVEGEQVTS
jgi:hypothetical protein